MISTWPDKEALKDRNEKYIKELSMVSLTELDLYLVLVSVNF